MFALDADEPAAPTRSQTNIITPKIETSPSAKNKIDLVDLMKSMTPERLKNMSEEDWEKFILSFISQFQRLAEGEWVQFYEKTFARSWITKWINEHRTFHLFLARVTRDHLALPKLARILGQKSKIIVYAVLMIASMVLAWFWRRYDRSLGGGLFFALYCWTKRTVLLLIFRVLIFVLIFHQEITPLWRIFRVTYYPLWR